MILIRSSRFVVKARRVQWHTRRNLRLVYASPSEGVDVGYLPTPHDDHFVARLYTSRNMRSGCGCTQYAWILYYRRRLIITIVRVLREWCFRGTPYQPVHKFSRYSHVLVATAVSTDQGVGSIQDIHVHVQGHRSV